MAVLQNLSFEVEGATAGQAASWTLAKFGAAAYDVAPFTGAGPLVDGFEVGWGGDTFQSTYDVASFAPASFTTLVIDTPTSIDSFEELWSNNQNYLTTLEGPTPATFRGPRLGVLTATPGLGIFDAGPVQGSTLFVVNFDDLGPTEVYVQARVDHPRGADLVVTILDPGATYTTGNVWNRQVAGPEGIRADVMFEPEAILFGLDGTWSIQVQDQAVGEVGTLVSWGVSAHGPRVPADTFDQGWSNDKLLLDWDDVEASAPVKESFAVGWVVGVYALFYEFATWSKAPVVSTVTGTETFEQVEAPRVFVVDSVPADTLRSTDIASSPSTAFQVELGPGGVAPGGLQTGPLYYVLNLPSADTVVLSREAGNGSTVVDLTDSGQGLLYLLADPAVFWNRLMVTV